MIKLVIDAYAWISYLNGDNSKVTKIIDDEGNELYTNVFTVAEVISKVKRKDMDIKIALEAINSLSIIFYVDFNFSKEVGLLHADIKKKIRDFGLADTFVLLTARKLNAKVLTGDPHF